MGGLLCSYFHAIHMVLPQTSLSYTTTMQSFKIIRSAKLVISFCEIVGGMLYITYIHTYKNAFL